MSDAWLSRKLTPQIKKGTNMTAATNAATNNHPGTDSDRYEDQRRAFRLHLNVFAGSMIIIFLVNLATNAAAGITGEWWAWWSVFALIGWALGLTVHGLVLRMARPQGVELP